MPKDAVSDIDERQEVTRMNKRNMTMFERIMVDLEICGEKLCIHSLRFPGSRLLGLLVSGETAETFRHVYPSLCSHLRTSRARYEYDDEAWWAQRLVAHSYPTAELSHYPGCERYITAVNFEMDLLNQARHTDFKHVLMIGSGPLPMTAILLAQRFGLHVDCLDVNPKACVLSREVIQALGLDQQVRVLQADIRDFTALASYEVVFWAALAGTSEEEKAQIARHLSCTMQPGQVVVVRSAQGIKTLFYAPVNPRDLIGFRVCPTLTMPPALIQSDFLVEKA
jgi:nicotianamine synthase